MSGAEILGLVADEGSIMMDPVSASAFRDMIEDMIADQAGDWDLLQKLGFDNQGDNVRVYL